MEDDIILPDNEYLTSKTEEIRGQIIPWDSFVKADLITESELKVIKQPSAEIILIFDKLSRIDTLQSLLVIFDDYLLGNKDHFINKMNQEKWSLSSLMKLLKKEDEYIQLKSGKILALLFSLLPPQEEYSQFLAYCSLHIFSEKEQVVDLLLQYLQGTLSVREYRILFYETDIMSKLASILGSTTKTQTQYAIIYILWLLSFDENICKTIDSRYHVVPLTKLISTTAIKEKVIRIILSFWKNLLLKAPGQNIVPILGSKVLDVVETLSNRKFTDEDIVEDILILEEELKKHVDLLTTFDEYRQEVHSKTLEWTPPHRSVAFWKQNSHKITKDMIGILLDLIKTSNDKQVLEIAASDIGNYIKHFSTGGKVIAEMGGKPLIMGLMMHEDKDVRYQALSAVQ